MAWFDRSCTLQTYSFCSRFNIISYLELHCSTGLRLLNGVDFLCFFTAGIIIIIMWAVLFSSTPILLILISSTAHMNSSDTKITGLFTIYSIREHGKLSLKLVFRFFLLLYNSYFQMVPPWDRQFILLDRLIPSSMILEISKQLN